MPEEIEQLQAENIALYMKDGPRFRTGYNTWVIARDRTAGAVLVGGLGAMGVGEMWVVAQDYHEQRAGWEDAPEASVRWPEFQWPTRRRRRPGP